MKMSKWFMIALLVLAGYTTALAQRAADDRQPRDPKEMAAHQTQRMAEALQLDAAQTERVGTINLDFAEKLQAARRAAFAAGDRTAMRSSMQQLREAQKAELKVVLTPEQFTQLEAHEKAMAERRGQQGEKPRSARKGKKAGRSAPERG